MHGPSFLWLIYGFPFPSVLFHCPEHGLGVSENGTPAAEEGHGNNIKKAHLQNKASLPGLWGSILQHRLITMRWAEQVKARLNRTSVSVMLPPILFGLPLSLAKGTFSNSGFATPVLQKVLFQAFWQDVLL